jgi:TetR/AcrR family transcriptional regulator, tetracycline repressor protein
LRDAMLAYRDGAELVATALAFGLGTEDPVVRLVDLIGDTPVARVAATTVLHFVLGHVNDEQMNVQAASAGAIVDEPLTRADTFSTGLGIVVAGIAAHQPTVRRDDARRP